MYAIWTHLLKGISIFILIIYFFGCSSLLLGSIQQRSRQKLLEIDQKLCTKVFSMLNQILHQGVQTCLDIWSPIMKGRSLQMFCFNQSKLLKQLTEGLFEEKCFFYALSQIAILQCTWILWISIFLWLLIFVGCRNLAFSWICDFMVLPRVDTTLYKKQFVFR